MDTEIREMPLEENDELSHEVDAILGEWDILEFYDKDKLVHMMWPRRSSIGALRKGMTNLRTYHSSKLRAACLETHERGN